MGCCPECILAMSSLLKFGESKAGRCGRPGTGGRLLGRGGAGRVGMAPGIAVPMLAALGWAGTLAGEGRCCPGLKFGVGGKVGAVAIIEV